MLEQQHPPGVENALARVPPLNEECSDTEPDLEAALMMADLEDEMGAAGVDPESNDGLGD